MKRFRAVMRLIYDQVQGDGNLQTFPCRYPEPSIPDPGRKCCCVVEPSILADPTFRIPSFPITASVGSAVELALVLRRSLGCQS